MKKYERVKGGEKNQKSGVPWSKEELLEVYTFYKKVKGVGLHERNPELQKVAAELGRTVRSTEAQALMYRNLDRGGSYSHGNMNKICKEIWKEMEKKENPESSKQYPEDLLYWGGGRKGGVKIISDKTSGRPNGFVIETQLTTKLNDWAKNIGRNRSPRILLLIGGPGNGKTDALEFLIDKIDKYHNTNFLETISSRIDSELNVSRTITIKNDSDNLKFDNIHIVPDASTGENLNSSEQCLVNDIEKVQVSNDIYLACINRGILAQALTLSGKIQSSSYKVFNAITKALTQNIEQLSLWPLQIGDSLNTPFGIWPMDTESLVKADESGYSPAKVIIKEAVREENWKCCNCNTKKELCPFYQNKDRLQNESNLDGLIKILRDFEIISNKRWTFRELFSIIAYILVGAEQDFNKLSPCDWSKSQIAKLASNDIKTEISTLWILNEHLYHFKLFNRWPNFNTIARSRANEYRSILSEFDELKSFFNYFSYTRSKSSFKPDVAKIIDEHFFYCMDPGQISNDKIKIGSTTLNEIESLYSYSVKVGFKKTANYLNPLEQTLFELLIRIESLIDNEVRMNTSNSNSKIDEFIALIRAIASKYFKRIYFSMDGRSKDYKYIGEFLMLNRKEDQELSNLKIARQLFDKLIHDKDKLDLSLNTSFGQPDPNPINRISLKVNRVQVKSSYTNMKFDDVPRIESAVLTINSKYYIPLTYQLHKALMMLDQNVRTSSLPEEVTAMLDNIKSRLGGIIVRNDNGLFNSTLKIGDSKNQYRISSAHSELEIEKDSQLQ
ncbi:hypothetical protein [Marinifilum fragile]|uniref:hypothetical protein n=1 Tax=Marinifilum fragile TaxID=570161 RepID=UPI002AAB94FD|nr:hypothetical protein [Marinifilum fragile]